MWRILLTTTVLLVACRVTGAAEPPPTSDGQEPGRVEGVTGTGVGKFAEGVVQFGERPKVRARDLPRAVYGNHRARIQAANGINQVSTGTNAIVEKYGLKYAGPALTLAEGGSGASGYLWEGDYRGAGTSLVNSGARELAAAGGAASAVWMLGAAGFSVGGPIGGAVGGAVGAVAAVVGYDLYLSEKVVAATEALWGEEHDPRYYLELAQKNRAAYLAEKAYYQNLARRNLQEFRARRERAFAILAEKTGFQPFSVELLRQPPQLAGTEQVGTISDNCTVETVGWWVDEPETKWSNTWRIRNGDATTTVPNFTFHGTLHGNVITGGWKWDNDSGVDEKLVFHPGGRLTWDADVYARDGSGMMRHSARKGEGTWRVVTPPIVELPTPSTSETKVEK